MSDTLVDKLLVIVLCLSPLHCGGTSPSSIENVKSTPPDRGDDASIVVVTPGGVGDNGADGGAADDAPDSETSQGEACSPIAAPGNGAYACSLDVMDHPVPTQFAWLVNQTTTCGWRDTPAACLCNYSCGCLKAAGACGNYNWQGCDDMAPALTVLCK